MSSAEVLAALAAALPAGVLIRDPDIVRGLSHDDAEWAPVGEPIALVRTASSTEVAAAVRICAGFGVPVTARGAGTGVGLLKRAGLSRELSPAVLDMHRAVKAALDPHNILNPGKVF
jgi:FAD/FMN-containing dehydrogenase